MSDLTRLNKQLEGIYRMSADNTRRLDYIEPRETGAGGLFAYGEIYDHDNIISKSIPIGAAYTKWTNWTANGLALNCTPNVANDRIDIDKPGIYKVSCSLSASANKSLFNLIGACFLNGVEQHQIHFRSKISVAGDEGAMSMTGLIDVTTANWALDVRFRHDNGTAVALVITYGNLNVIYIGPT